MSMSKFASQADYWKVQAERAEAKLAELNERYMLPSDSMGAKKLEQLGGLYIWKPIGLVLHNSVESVAITEHGRVTWVEN